ncbi:CTP synthase C-terminal region-related (seleno)protein [Streptomyces sp. DSM 41634]|uniref:CTP synthase C-terminal region-related (seleno)protein n=1 Tax=Streptomyces sp. DSM 41634 TaxID=3448656 RepID=UPI00403FFF3E
MTTAQAAQTAQISQSTQTTPAARIALVGDRSPHVKSHTRIPLLLDALASRDGLVLDAYWIPTGDAEAEATAGTLARFDAVWVLPGSPYASEAGALAAIRVAREEGIPFLGTCGGFQHTLLEYARTVCGLAAAAHAENDPGAADPLIAPLACSLVGHEGLVRAEPGSLAEAAIGAERSMERYHCNYGPAPRHLPTLTAHGLRLSGHDEEGQARIAELPGHPFFLATLFQPELHGDGTRPHPIVRALAAAAVAHAGGRRGGVAARLAATLAASRSAG